MGKAKLCTKLTLLLPVIFSVIFIVSKVQGQVIGTKIIAISPEAKSLNNHKLNKQSLQLSGLQTIVALNDGIAEGMSNPQAFDLDGNGVIDPNGSADYLFVVFEPSDFAAYGLQFPVKITGASFYNNSSLTNYPEIMVANVIGTLESGSTVDLFNPLAVEQNVLGPTEGFTNVTFPLAPTIFQETSIALLIQFPEGDQYSGIGENGGPGIGLDFDGIDNPSYPPFGIPNRNGNSFVFDLEISQDSWKVINIADNEPINLMMNLVVEPATYPTSILPPDDLEANIVDDNVKLNWQPPGTTSLTELLFDDGSFESYYGFNNGIGILASGAFIPPSYPATLSDVEFLTSGAQAGTNVKINIYVDLSGTAFKPSSAFFVGSVETVIGTGGEFQVVDLTPLAITLQSGQFFIGIESMGQGNIELGNDDDTLVENWYDSTLEGMFYLHNVPGVYAIRSKVGLQGNEANSTFRQITLKQKSINHSSSLYKSKITENAVNQGNFTGAISVMSENKPSFKTTPMYLTGLQSYKIYRSSQTNAKFTGVAIGEVDKNTLSFEDIDPKINTNYYVVTANYGEGESDPSNEVSVFISSGDPIETPAGIIAWWKGEDNAADSSENNNHGTLQNGATFDTGLVDRSFLLDGIDDYVSANPNILSGATAASVEGWIKLNTYASNGQSTIVIDRKPGYDDFQFAVAPDNNYPHKLFFHIWTPSGNNYFAPSTTDIPINIWTHVAGVYDGSEIRVYINGQPDGTPVPATGSIRSISDNLQIGDDPWNPGFKGQIDELSIYNRALTNAEIQSIYAAGSAGKKAPKQFPKISANPTNLDFGDVTVGQNTELQFTIQNTGNAILTVNSIVNSNSQFTLVSDTSPFNIPLDSQKIVTVRFSPNSDGQQTDSLEINSNDPDKSKIVVQLKGVGVSSIVSSPAFSPNQGVFDSPQDITINTTTADAKIYYTLNEKEPTELDAQYTSPIKITKTTMIKAKAFKENWAPSPVISGTFTIRSSISGKVMDYQNQDPIQGAELNLTGIISKSTRTDAQANYQFTKILTGYNYKIVPVFPGVFFQPPSIEYINLDTNQEDQNFVGSLYGDISGNDEIKAFDASILLRYTVGSINLSNPKRDSIAADVSGDGNIKSFDASLILRQIVGVISGFPVEGYSLDKSGFNFSNPIVHLEGDYSASDKKLMVYIYLENAKDVYSADLTFSINPNILKLNSVKIGEITSDFLLAHSVQEKEIHIGIAGISPVNMDGKLLYLHFDLLSSNGDKNEIPLELVGISFDENDQDIQIINRSLEIETIPNQFTLLQNHPNPFNSETIIRYQIPANISLTNKSNSSINENETAHVKLKIVNLLGHEVRDLVNTSQKPGEYKIVWDGKDQLGNAVSSGIYFYFIQAGDFKDKKKMLFLQ